MRVRPFEPKVISGSGKPSFFWSSSPSDAVTIDFFVAVIFQLLNVIVRSSPVSSMASFGTDTGALAWDMAYGQRE